MKASLLLLIFLSAFFNAKAYEVEDGKEQGFTVSADNLVYITTPNGEKIQVTKIPFVGEENGYRYSIPPVEPILCTWDPSHRWMGIFITVKKITEIHFFNLQTSSLLKPDPKRPKYPDWFGNAQWFAHTKPVRWSENKLFLDSLVKFKDGSSRHLHETITINGDMFQRVVE